MERSIAIALYSIYMGMHERREALRQREQK